MAIELRMPALDLTGDEIRIVRWQVREGEAVQAGDVLLEVETEKATLDVASTHAGTLLRIMADDGAIVEVGDIVCYIGAAGEGIPWLPPRAEEGRLVAAAAPSPAVSAPEDAAGAAPLIA
jgi:pyruvate/2-oxoglutarate dehydrogenase complex dihydrolipoamide acyltransferase (E2) component